MNKKPKTINRKNKRRKIIIDGRCVRGVPDCWGCRDHCGDKLNEVRQ